MITKDHRDFPAGFYCKIALNNRNLQLHKPFFKILLLLLLRKGTASRAVLGLVNQLLSLEGIFDGKVL
jgi:hypothetical protein